MKGALAQELLSCDLAVMSLSCGTSRLQNAGQGCCNIAFVAQTFREPCMCSFVHLAD